MSRSINDLAPEFRPLAIELLARCVESKISVLIVDTLRTQAEHQENLRAGTSRIRHSKHLDGLAIDICPFAIYQLHGPDKLQWDGRDPVWPILGAIGERLRLRWGGRFWPLNDVGIGWDPGHFEYITPSAISGTAA